MHCWGVAGICDNIKLQTHVSAIRGRSTQPMNYLVPAEVTLYLPIGCVSLLSGVSVSLICTPPTHTPQRVNSCN